MVRPLNYFFFFYVCLPLVISNFDDTWTIKTEYKLPRINLNGKLSQFGIIETVGVGNFSIYIFVENVFSVGLLNPTCILWSVAASTAAVASSSRRILDFLKIYPKLIFILWKWSIVFNILLSDFLSIFNIFKNCIC